MSCSFGQVRLSTVGNVWFASFATSVIGVIAIEKTGCFIDYQYSSYNKRILKAIKQREKEARHNVRNLTPLSFENRHMT